MEAAGEEQDGLSIHSPGQAPPSSASSLPMEQSQVELELRVLEALEIYPPSKLQGIHRHFVLYGLMEYLHRSFDRHFSADEVLQLLDRFFNLEMLALTKAVLCLHSGPYLVEPHPSKKDKSTSSSDPDCWFLKKPDDEETDTLNQEEDFSLPPNFFVKDEQ